MARILVVEDEPPLAARPRNLSAVRSWGVEAEGRLNMWQIAVKPGKPVAFAPIDDSRRKAVLRVGEHRARGAALDQAREAGMGQHLLSRRQHRHHRRRERHGRRLEHEDAEVGPLPRRHL